MKLKKDKTMTQKETQQLIECCLENIDAVYCVCNNHPEIKDIEAITELPKKVIEHIR